MFGRERQRVCGIWSLFGGLVYGVRFVAGGLGVFPMLVVWEVFPMLVVWEVFPMLVGWVIGCFL